MSFLRAKIYYFCAIVLAYAQKFMDNRLPEIVFSSSDSAISAQIRKLVRQGQLRALLPRVYTSNLDGIDEEIVRRNANMLISHLFPGSLLSHRSALEYLRSPKHNLYLTGNNRRVYKWPGLTIRFTEGPAPLSNDQALYEQLFVSSLERACLENLLPSRKVAGEKRTLGQEVIEDKLLMILNTRGEDELNDFRDRAKEIAMQFGWEKAFQTLHQIVSALLSTKPSSILVSPIAAARALGEPYDPYRINLFQQMIQALRQQVWPDRPQKTGEPKAFSNFSFFESYFSNYIEGTTFTVEEAEDIIFAGLELPNRSGDAHDIRGTYMVCSIRSKMARIPNSSTELIEIMQDRHLHIMGGRPELQPGYFKEKANRAGSTHFVAPNLVRGTLKHGFQFISALTEPFSRAIYMLFLISEVHPFNDGNGRIARIMMNAELVHAQQSKIIIPTVYRDDYILNLKKLTQQQKLDGFIQMMAKIHHYSHWLEPMTLDLLQTQLKATNAFKESNEAVIILPD